MESNGVNCSQHAACALQFIDILQETKTATAVSNQITIDEETEGVIPEIVLPPFSQKETYLDVKVSNDLTKHEHEIQLTNEVPIQQKPYPLPLASC